MDTDEALFRRIGERLARQRIQSGLTQQQLADQAGVGRSTVERLESGHSTQMSSFVRILRVLGLLDEFVAVFPDTGPSPMELLRHQRKERQRASSRRAADKAGKAVWRWDDES